MHSSIAAVLVIVVAVVVVNSSEKEKITTDPLVFSYLQTYGYLDSDALSSGNETIAAAVKRAISLFQEYYQLPGDGALNEVTLRFMRKPRCGLEDIPRATAFNSAVAKWPRNHLTWNFHLADAEVLRLTEEAFAIWSANSSLTFERSVLRPDILISYRNGIHTFAHNRLSEIVCPSRLDGLGNILGHAFFPSGGDDYISEVHIDEEEPWYIFLGENPPNTYSLLHTLTHEIGHSLGLRHGTRNDSVMFPIAPNNGYPVKLSVEDVLGIQNLYGARNEGGVATTPSTTTTTTRTTTTRFKDICEMTRVDAVLILEHRIFIAYKQYVWSIGINGGRKTYDKPIVLGDYFKQNITRVQAAYQRPSGDIVLFANGMIYVVKYPSFDLVDGWPRSFESIRLPANSKINAAVNTNKGRTFVIFNDDNVAEIDECSMQVSRFYSIDRIFPGIPSSIVSFAFRHTDGHLYFVGKNEKFYKFSDFYNTMTTAGDFDLSILGIECPRDGLLRQLRELLDGLVRSFANYPEEEEEEEEEANEEQSRYSRRGSRVKSG